MPNKLEPVDTTPYYVKMRSSYQMESAQCVSTPPPVSASDFPACHFPWTVQVPYTGTYWIDVEIPYSSSSPYNPNGLFFPSSDMRPVFIQVTPAKKPIIRLKKKPTSRKRGKAVLVMKLENGTPFIGGVELFLERMRKKSVLKGSKRIAYLVNAADNGRKTVRLPKLKKGNWIAHLYLEEDRKPSYGGTWGNVVKFTVRS